MNRFYLLICCLIFSKISAQNQPTKYNAAFIKNLIDNRITLSEKHNEPLHLLPTILMNAWRSGAIQGRHPFVPDAKIGFGQIAKKFGIKTKQGDFLGVNANSKKSINLVNNGDFEKGNTGFSSKYSFNISNYAEATYSVGNDASVPHSGFYGFDHSGTGKFMIVNGTGVKNSNVWFQTINVTPNTQFTFSCWISSLVESSPALLQFSINNTQIGPIFTAPSLTGTWQEFSTTWNSGPNKTATICIVNQNTEAMGNDFGIDDISFAEIQPSVKFACCNQIPVDKNEALKRVNDWSKGSYPGMDAVFDIIENKVFDKNTSMEVYEQKFIRLSFVDPNNPNDYDAVVMFDFEEILPILHAAHAKNRNNDATTLTFRQVLELRDFTAVTIQVSGTNMRTLDDAQKEQQKFIKSEEELHNK